jgi:hypothetical protein
MVLSLSKDAGGSQAKKFSNSNEKNAIVRVNQIKAYSRGSVREKKFFLFAFSP